MKFRNVVCSSGDIAFFCTKVPKSDLVVELGLRVEPKYLRARVISSAIDAKRNEYLVHCEFIERIDTLLESSNA